MNIVERSIGDIRPYEKNPRKNAKAVGYVAESIRQFGFKVPLVVDRDGVIVTGHTRYKAAKQLGLETVPCIVADDLTEEQIKAFRLADNKVAEKAEWDFDLLDGEIADLTDWDMEALGFDFSWNSGEEEEPEEEFEQEPERKQNERLRTDYAYNLPFVDLDRTEGKYQMPIIEPENHLPDSLIGFNYALSSNNKSAGVHFYVDDYQFERIWNEPERYIEVLRDYDCVLTPDFSLYLDMPYSMKIWNVFRSRLIGQMCQDAGLAVIPTVSWAEPETFDFCFDGLPERSVLSISTIGVKNSPEAMQIWRDGVTELIKRKKPKTLLVYGGKVDFDYGKTKVLYFANSVTERMKKGGSANDD